MILCFYVRIAFVFPFPLPQCFQSITWHVRYICQLCFHVEPLHRSQYQKETEQQRVRPSSLHAADMNDTRNNSHLVLLECFRMTEVHAHRRRTAGLKVREGTINKTWTAGFTCTHCSALIYVGASDPICFSQNPMIYVFPLSDLRESHQTRLN